MNDPYANVKSSLRYGGTILRDNKEIGETARCVHCDTQFLIEKKMPGRGFCFRCNGYICGKGCMECIPWELKMEIMEGKLPSEVLAPRIIVPRDIGE